MNPTQSFVPKASWRNSSIDTGSTSTSTSSCTRRNAAENNAVPGSKMSHSSTFTHAASFSPATNSSIENSPDLHLLHNQFTDSPSPSSTQQQLNDADKKLIHLAVRLISTDAFKKAYRSAHVRTRLTLMLALVPWSRSTYQISPARFWTITTATFAGFGCVALLLPRVRLYAIFLRQELARVLRQPVLTPVGPAGTTTVEEKGYVKAVVVKIVDEISTPKTPERQILQIDERGELSCVEEVIEEESHCEYESDSESEEEERDRMNDIEIASHLPRRLAMGRSYAKSISVSTVFDASGPTSPMRPMPAERIGNSPTQPQFAGYFSPVHDNASPIRGRNAFTNSKRLSLNFPIQPPSTRSSRPPSWHTSPVQPLEHKPAAEGNFLTILAAQERRVLELKEELKRAEEELSRLKNQWSAHEMVKKKQQTRRVLPLQPLATDFSFDDRSEDEMDETQQLAQKEIDRRRMLLSGVRSSGRKVFSGSRHTRTLSLLSPDKGTLAAPFQLPTDSPRKKLNPPFNPRHSLERSTTSPDIRTIPENHQNPDIFNEITGVPKDAILTAGKQMMGDMKDTFWTFVGDIKQATVGSEAINGPASIYASSHHQHRPLGRSKSHRSTPTHEKRPTRSSNLITSQPRGQSQKMDYASTKKEKEQDISSSFWREHGILESPHAGLRRSSASHKPKQPIPQPKQSTTNLIADDDSSWDAWGTPTPTPSKTPSRPETSYAIPTTVQNMQQHRNGSLSSGSSVNTNSESTSSPSSPTLEGTPASSTITSGSEWPPNLARLSDGSPLGLLGDWEKAVHS